MEWLWLVAPILFTVLFMYLVPRIVNSRFEKIEVGAKVISKNVAVGPESSMNFCVFHCDDDKTVDLVVESAKEYKKLSEGDVGTLTYRGPLFIGFKKTES